MAHRPKILRILMIILFTSTIGCHDEPDSRVEKVMQESLQRQAEQSQQIAEQSRLSAESVRRVVEAESDARSEVVELQRDIVERDDAGRKQLAELSQTTHNQMNAERVALDNQRADVDQERRQLALERNRDPIVAQSIVVVGITLACLIPLFLAGYVLYSLNRGDADEDFVNEVLVSEITAHCPNFLAAESPRLADQRSGSATPPTPESD